MNKKIKQLSEQFYFEIDEQTLNYLEKSFDDFLNNINLFNQFDINNVEPMDYPVNISCSILRKDIPVQINEPKSYFKNSKFFDGQYIKINNEKI